jgi:hypothetical protein
MPNPLCGNITDPLSRCQRGVGLFLSCVPHCISFRSQRTEAKIMAIQPGISEIMVAMIINWIPLRLVTPTAAATSSAAAIAIVVITSTVAPVTSPSSNHSLKFIVEVGRDKITPLSSEARSA